MSDEKHETGSQADELTEMWDAASLREAGFAADEAERKAAEEAAAARATSSGAAGKEPSIQIAPSAAGDTGRHPSQAALRRKKKKKKKKGLDALGLPAQIAIAVLVALSTFFLVRLLMS